MKVIIINSSPHQNGNTAIAINEMIKVFKKEDVDYQVFNIGNEAIRSCLDCGKCHTLGYCILNDSVNEVAKEFEKADGLVVASPVYFAQANGALVSFLQRLFVSTPFDKTMKIGASIGAARRGGLTTTYDELNKFFGISGMPIASGQYWNGIHGGKEGEANEDLEGLQMMRTLANNMVFLMKAIALGKKKYGLPKKEKKISTNFIRKD